nr:hypothetical protein BaRGS_024461 [Batillaria attramentaria]
METLTGGEVAFIFVTGLLLLAAVVCNIMIVVVVVLNPKMRNPTDVLICNIAVSDLLLAAVVLPQNLHDISHSEDNYHEGDFLCRFVYAMPLLLIMNSIFSMVVISVERKRSIVLNVGKRLTVRGVLFIAVGVWVLAFAFCIPTIYEHSQYVNDVPQADNETSYACGSNGVSYAFSLSNGVGLLLVAYVIPLAILMYNYTRIVLFFSSAQLIVCFT